MTLEHGNGNFVSKYGNAHDWKSEELWAEGWEQQEIAKTKRGTRDSIRQQ